MKLPLLTILLGVLNVVLMVAIGMRVIGGASIEEEVEQAAATATAPAPTPAAIPTSARFDFLQSQAVFHKSRNFYIAPAAPVVQQPPPDYRIVGLMSLPNRPPSAVLMSNQTNARVKVAVGDQFEGWNVADVSAKRVLVQLGDRTAEINSATRAPAGGITVTSGSQASTAAASPGVVRVLGTPGAAVAVPPRASAPADSAPRLYRPPTSQ